MRVSHIHLIFALILAGHVNVAWARDYKIIVHPSVGVDSLDSTAIKKILLAKSKKWPNGKGISLFLMPGKLQKAVARDLTGKSSSQFRMYWRREVFTGKAVHPKRVKSDTEMLRRIRTVEGAIGFISADKNVEGVKVIEIRE